MKESEVRGRRQLKVVVRTLHALTERFSGRAPSEMDKVSGLPNPNPIPNPNPNPNPNPKFPKFPNPT